MDNSNSIQANSALPDPEKEKFEQEEQKKYEQFFQNQNLSSFQLQKKPD